MPEGKDEKKSNLIEECKKKADEYLAGWQRAKADYENLEKQTLKEKAELIRNANSDLVLSILPILDNFEKAEEHKPSLESCSAEDREKISQWIDGIDQTFAQLYSILQSAGVERYEVLGKDFNPETMEAVEQASEPEKEEGIVLVQLLSGYKFNGRVIRPARVIVNKINK